MTNRERLPNRRLSITTEFTHETQKFFLTTGFIGNKVMEIFLNSSQKSGSEADINASDAAIAVSLAIQYGCPMDVLRHAMRRNADGSPTGPISHALDIAKEIEESIT